MLMIGPRHQPGTWGFHWLNPSWPGIYTSALGGFTLPGGDTSARRKLRLIEGNAKCRHLKNGLVKGLCGRCLSAWGSEPHNPPSNLHTVYVYRVYLFIQGRGGGRVEPETRGKGQQGRVQLRKLCWKCNMTECTQDIGYLQSINSDKHLPRSPFTVQVDFFRWRHFALTFMSLIFRGFCPMRVFTASRPGRL